MACSAAYVTADDVAEFLCRTEGYSAQGKVTLDDVNRYIKKTAARINVHLSAGGQCACTWSAYAADYLQELNMIMTALLIQCPECSRHLSDEERQYYYAWIDQQLGLLREGKLDLCEGATAADYPALGWAAQGWTEFNQARIIVDDVARNS
ncbi:MAG TPA: hypothetical protein VM537_17645 [Anaerolineae bacterium]|nr:hypothetical protein [Anaerolineae bacterium]